MEELDQSVILHFRRLAREGATLSQILRSSFTHVGPQVHKLTLIKYVRKAFGLTLQEASPIAGWSSDGDGDLSDVKLDELVTPEIRKRQMEWE